MRVLVKLFAALGCHTDAPPGTSLEVNLPEPCALSDLIARLKVPRDEVKMIFVNGRARPMDWILQADDQVGIFPPIGGG